jgi:hypothetical protein
MAPRDPGSVHDNLRKLADSAQKVLTRVPEAAAKGSPRSKEHQRLLGTDCGGGRERANLHDKLSADMAVFATNTGIVVSGIADLFEAGVGERGMNTQALTILVRAPVEMAAQMLWLLDSDIDADARIRRYLMWRLSDLNSQRKVAEHADPSPEILQALDKREQRILRWVESAKWEGHARDEAGNGSPPALLDTSDPEKPRRLAVPRIHELVRTMTTQPLIYALMSVPSHGDRWAVMETLRATGEPTSDGRQLVGVSGFALDPNMIKLLAQGAIFQPTIRLADWNGVDRSALNEPVQRLNAVTFR